MNLVHIWFNTPLSLRHGCDSFLFTIIITEEFLINNTTGDHIEPADNISSGDWIMKPELSCPIFHVLTMFSLLSAVQWFKYWLQSKHLSTRCWRYLIQGTLLNLLRSWQSINRNLNDTKYSVLDQVLTLPIPVSEHYNKRRESGEEGLVYNSEMHDIAICTVGTDW